MKINWSILCSGCYEWFTCLEYEFIKQKLGFGSDDAEDVGDWDQKETEEYVDTDDAKDVSNGLRSEGNKIVRR